MIVQICFTYASYLDGIYLVPEASQEALMKEALAKTRIWTAKKHTSTYVSVVFNGRETGGLIASQRQIRDLWAVKYRLHLLPNAGSKPIIRDEVQYLRSLWNGSYATDLPDWTPWAFINGLSHRTWILTVSVMISEGLLKIGQPRHCVGSVAAMPCPYPYFYIIAKLPLELQEHIVALTKMQDQRPMKRNMIDTAARAILWHGF